MRTDLVIFDLDGVLVDACEWHRIALNEALKEVCNYEISLNEHNSTFNGIPTKIKLNILKKQNIIQDKDVHEIYKKKQIKTIEIINSKCTVRQEKIDMIDFLKSNGIKVACYTNSIRETGSLMLKKTGIYDLLDLFISNQEVLKPKPDPSGYIKIMQHFKVNRSNTLIIEDSQKGLQAALDSGAKVIKVIGPDCVNIRLFKGEK
jgi:beta-phosphoglucomutase